MEDRSINISRLATRYSNDNLLQKGDIEPRRMCARRMRWIMCLTRNVDMTYATPDSCCTLTRAMPRSVEPRHARGSPNPSFQNTFNQQMIILVLGNYTASRDGHHVPCTSLHWVPVRALWFGLFSVYYYFILHYIFMYGHYLYHLESYSIVFSCLAWHPLHAPLPHPCFGFSHHKYTRIQLYFGDIKH